MSTIARVRRSLLLVILGGGLGALAMVVACSDDPEVRGAPEAGTFDAHCEGWPEVDGDVPDVRSPADAGADVRDAARPKRDANGPGMTGDDCVFNQDCQAALRCECSEGEGCSCQPGARGTGQAGIDECDENGNGADCESALCLEGPGGVYYCSDQCDSVADCTGVLPLCSEIAFVGKVCIRDPNAQ